TKTQRTQAIRLAAEALIEQKKIPEAVATLEAAYKADPNSDLKLDYARTLILADRRQDAIPLFQQLQAKQPDNPDLAYTLGLLHLEDKAFAQAKPLLQKLQKHEKYADDATYFLGKVYEGLNQPKAAISTYQRIQGGEQLPAATQRIIELISKTEGAEQARQWIIQERAATSSEFRQLLLLRAEALWLHDQAQYRAAIDVLNQALKLRPDHFDLLYSRALNAEKAGDFAAAETDLRALLAKRPDNATVLNALGYMLTVNTDRFAEAEGLIRKALQVNPDDAAIMDSLGWVLFRQGRAQEAETWLRKAYEALPEPEITSHLAEVLVANGKKAEAETLLNKMLSEFPNDKVLQKAKAKLAGSS
ncbi:MAG: tetratricopeptide repeat protein, partial [Thiothrix sp.]